MENQSIERFNVLGVGVSAIHLQTAQDAVLHALETKQKGYVCVTGVHGVSEAQENPAFRQILNKAFLNTPDGMPLVWLGKRWATAPVDRVYGPDLLPEICAATENTEFSHFFYGGAPGVAEELSSKLKERFPQLTVAGHYCPPFRPLSADEQSDFIAQIESLKPDIIWVGLSTPKQELFMSEYCERLNTTLMLGVGAAFDFHSGRKKQAPRWIQRSGLEWLFRLITEPKRLGKRYLKNNPLFILRIISQIIGLRKYSLDR